MKSIKEKSLEVFPEHCNYFTSNDNERKRIGFIAGANYVLEQIKQLICQKHVEGNLPLFDLTRFIDKLKEK